MYWIWQFTVWYSYLYTPLLNVTLQEHIALSWREYDVVYLFLRLKRVHKRRTVTLNDNRDNGCYCTFLNIVVLLNIGLLSFCGVLIGTSVTYSYQDRGYWFRLRGTENAHTDPNRTPREHFSHSVLLDVCPESKCTTNLTVSHTIYKPVISHLST